MNGHERESYQIVVDKLVLSRNELDKMHWATRHKETRDWEQQIKFIGFKGRVPKAATKMHVVITAYRPRLISDDANLRGGCKPLFDALKRLGAIVDDSDKWIRDEYEQVMDPEAKTVIRLSKMDDKNEIQQL